jgi:hypothetical protein
MTCGARTAPSSLLKVAMSPAAATLRNFYGNLYDLHIHSASFFAIRSSLSVRRCSEKKFVDYGTASKCLRDRV